MIAEELRQAIRLLKAQSRPLREISRALKVSRNTVRRVLREPQRPETPAEDPRIQAVVDRLPNLYRHCKGNAVRIGEVLNEAHGMEIAYSTLTRLIREHTELRTPPKRSGTYTFGPGEEMQHDTSAHRLSLGNKIVTAQRAWGHGLGVRSRFEAKRPEVRAGLGSGLDSKPNDQRSGGPPGLLVEGYYSVLDPAP